MPAAQASQLNVPRIKRIDAMKQVPEVMATIGPTLEKPEDLRRAVEAGDIFDSGSHFLCV